jgi:penicillin-binding protein 2
VKPLIALAGLDSGLRTPEDKVFSTGEFHIPSQRRGYRDAHGGAGWTDLRKSIAASVNFYDYKLAYEMGITRSTSTCASTGRRADRHRPRGETSAWCVAEWKAKRSKDGMVPGRNGHRGIGQRAIGWRRRLQLARRCRGDRRTADASCAAPGPRVAMVTTRLVADPAARSAAHHRQPRQPARVQEGMMMTMQPGGTGFSLVPARRT